MFKGDIGQFLQFTQPNGQRIICETVRQFREQYGERWKDEFCEQNPHAGFLAEICAADLSGEEAFENLREYVGNQFSKLDIFNRTMALSMLDVYKPSLINLHTAIRAEITRPLN